MKVTWIIYYIQKILLSKTLKFSYILTKILRKIIFIFIPFTKKIHVHNFSFSLLLFFFFSLTFKICQVCVLSWNFDLYVRKSPFSSIWICINANYKWFKLVHEIKAFNFLLTKYTVLFKSYKIKDEYFLVQIYYARKDCFLHFYCE